MSTQTAFASMDNYAKGGVEITGNESASRYLFSNMFEVAAKALPWQRIVVAKNLEFTIEVARAEGDSPWYICAHDETVLVMEGVLEVHLVKPADASLQLDEDHEGAVCLADAPNGTAMGHVRASRGHLTLLPAGSAYQLRPSVTGVALFQSALGPESIEKWAEICQR